MAAEEQLAKSLRDIQELESFVHELVRGVAGKKLRHGEDLAKHAKELGIRIPDLVKGSKVTWDTRREFEDELKEGNPLVLVRSGDAGALGFTVGCIRIGRRIKICLECGWLYCKIVIKGTF